MMPQQLVPAVTGCPSCGGQAELEEEDGVRKWCCIACFFEFGFTEVQQEDSCSLGVPEEVRRGHSAIPVDQVLNKPGALVMLSGADIPIGRPE